MKQCPVCKTNYTDDSLNFCLNDGAALTATSNSELTQRMSFGSNPTFENNQPIRVNLQTETPTQNSVPINTTQIKRKGISPLLILTIVGLLTIGGICIVALAYFAFTKKDNMPPVISTPTPPIATLTPTPAAQNLNTPDDTKELKDKLAQLEKQLNDQKNSKGNPSVPVISTKPPISSPTPAQTTRAARVNSPNDGFLALRSSPGAKDGNQVLQIPHGAIVAVGDCQGYITTAGRRGGRWCKVYYAGQQGWAFDAFLIY